MKLTVDILKDVVATLSFDIPIKSITSAGTDTFGRESWDVEVCNTYHLIPFCEVTLDSKVYTITAVSNDASITIRENNPGQGVPSITTFPVPAPYYRHGSVIDVNDELVKIDDSTDKFPLVYANEPFDERIINDPESSLNRNSTLRLFMLGRFDREDWNTDDHYTFVIQAMNNLADELINYFINEKGFGVFDGHDRRNHVNLSVQRTLKGQETQIFDDYLSGTEIRLTLPITKSCVFLQCN